MAPPTGKRIRILVADDHDGIREAVATVFDGEQDMQVIGQAKDGKEAVQLARALAPQVVVMDIRMPGMDGLAATREIAMAGLPCRVLILTAEDLRVYGEAAREAGAWGIMAKTCPAPVLQEAVRAIADGRSLFGDASCSD